MKIIVHILQRFNDIFELNYNKLNKAKFIKVKNIEGKA